MVLSRIQQERAAEEEERQQRQRDIEETMALAAVSEAGGGIDPGHSRRVQVLKRQSQRDVKPERAKRTSVGSSSTPRPSSSSASTTTTNQRIDDTSTGGQISLAPAADKSTDTTSSSSSTTVPDKYQKLLNIGLHQDQVKHKMVQDGFDPTTVGW